MYFTIVLRKQKVYVKVLPTAQLPEVIQADLDLHLAVWHHKRPAQHRAGGGSGRIHQATHPGRLGAVLELQSKVVNAFIQRIPELWPKEHLVDVQHKASLRLHREHTVVVERRVPAVGDLQGILSGQEEVVLLVNQLPHRLDDRIRVTPLL